MAGLTLDSGALIAFERADRDVLTHLKEARLRGLELRVPVVVIAEVWRGGARSVRISTLLQACLVDPLTEEIARRAGEAVGHVRGAGVIDAIVMASAAQRSGAVLTSDLDDLAALSSQFSDVKLISIKAR